MQKFGVQEGDVQRALLSGDPQDPIAIAYNLIIDNKRFVDEGEQLPRPSSLLLTRDVIDCASR